jgi:hypothetical protein
MKTAKSWFVVLFCLVCSILPTPAHAQQPTPTPTPAPRPTPTPTPTFAGFRLYEENDSIFTIGGDDRYTQGLRVEVDLHPDKLPTFAQRDWALWLLRPRVQGASYGLAFSFGQNLYTPRIITTRTPEANDRGFTDFNYLGMSHTALSANELKRSQLEVLVGWMGVRDLSNGAQGGLHALRQHRLPRGWETTSPTGPRIHVSTHFDRRTETKNRCADKVLCADATFGYGTEFGAVRNGVNGRVVLRVGHGLSGFPSSTVNPGVTRSERKNFEAGVYGGVEGRLLAHTSLVNPTPGTTGFKKEHAVLDLTAGVFARVGALRLTIQPGFFLRRSREFSTSLGPAEPQHFTSVQVSYEPVMDRTNTMPSVFRHLKIELGMGSSLTGLGSTVGSGKGLVNHIALRRRLFGKKAWAVEAGLEKTSLGLSTTPTPGEPGNTSNLFVGQFAGSLGFTLEPHSAKYGLFGVRFGMGIRNMAKTETIVHFPLVAGRLDEKTIEGAPIPSRSGGWLVGAQYYLPLESHVSLGFDVARHHLKLDPAVPFLTGSNYWRFSFGVQLRTRAAVAEKKK